MIDARPCTRYVVSVVALTRSVVDPSRMYPSEASERQAFLVDVHEPRDHLPLLEVTQEGTVKKKVTRNARALLLTSVCADDNAHTTARPASTRRHSTNGTDDGGLYPEHIDEHACDTTLRDAHPLRLARGACLDAVSSPLRDMPPRASPTGAGHASTGAGGLSAAATNGITTNLLVAVVLALVAAACAVVCLTVVALVVRCLPPPRYTMRLNVVLADCAQSSLGEAAAAQAHHIGADLAAERRGSTLSAQGKAVR